MITRRMDLWEMGLHVGLVGDAEAEGAAMEDRDASERERRKMPLQGTTTTL